MNKQIILKQEGMTLIELTVVLLILTSLATIALRSTTGLVEQTKWEQTKKRHEEIKKAIIGDPKLVINDQPDISGFVADMGRLPNNIRELLSEAYCKVDYTKDLAGCPTPVTNWIKQNPGYCESDYSKKQASCPSADWNTTGLAAPATSTQLGFGWNGPYLITSLSHADKFAFADSWGRYLKDASGDPDVSDVNYGWNFEEPAKDASGSPILDSLGWQSYGKDHNVDYTTPSDSYNIDYPPSLVSGTPPVARSPSVLVQNDWKVNISGGIEVAINSSGIGSCDVSTITNGNQCIDAGWNWPVAFNCFDPISGTPIIPIVSDYSACTITPPTPSNVWRWEPISGCFDPSITAASSCTSPAAWVSSAEHCSNGISPTEALCIAATPAGTWIKGICTYPSVLDKLTCTTAPAVATKKWAECKDSSPSTPSHSKSFCETHGARWNDSPDVCLRINYKSVDAAGDTIITSSWDSYGKSSSTGTPCTATDTDCIGNTITTTSVRQTLLFDGFKHFTAATPPATIPVETTPTPPVFLPSGKAKFQVFHFDNVNTKCSNLPYPANTCELPHSNAVAITASAAACTGATPSGIWESSNGFCYGLSDAAPNDCGTLGGSVVSKVPATPISPVIKSIIPHKAIPQIVW